MIVTLYTPTTKLISEIEAKAVYLPSSHGDMEILENHVPVLSSLKEGTIKITTVEEKTLEIQIHSGYVQYSDDKMTIVIEQTHLTEEEIHDIQERAKSLRSKEFSKEKITEDEFEHFEDSLHGIKN